MSSLPAQPCCSTKLSLVRLLRAVCKLNLILCAGCTVVDTPQSEPCPELYDDMSTEEWIPLLNALDPTEKLENNATVEAVSGKVKELLLGDRLQQIEELDLTNSKIEAVPNAIALGLENLKILKLPERFDLKCKGYLTLSQKRSLEELSIHGRLADSADIEIIKVIPCLQRLSIKLAWGLNIAPLRLEKYTHLRLGGGTLMTDVDFWRILNSENLISLDLCGQNLRPILHKLRSKKRGLDEYPLPPSPRYKSSIKKLRLDACGLSYRDLPELIHGCSKLKVLDLSNNDLSHSYNISNLLSRGLKSSLEALSMSNCGLACNDMVSIQSCKNLKALDLSLNNLSGDCISTLLNSDIKFTLETLRLCECNLSYEDAVSVRMCTQLKVLDLSKNNFSKAVAVRPYSLFKFTRRALPPLSNSSLGFLGQTVTAISNSFLECSKGTLVELNISGCSLPSEFLADIFECRNLQVLLAPVNNLSSAHPNDIVGSPSMGSLRTVDFHDCKMSDTKLLSTLLHFPEIAKLRLSGNNLSGLVNGVIFTEINKKIKDLDLSKCSIHNAGVLTALLESKHLERLVLAGNKFIDIPTNFNFKNEESKLKELSLCDCGPIGPGLLKSVLALPALKDLDMSRNDLGVCQNELTIDSAGNSLITLKFVSCDIRNWSFVFKILNYCPGLEELNLHMNRNLCIPTKEDIPVDRKYNIRKILLYRYYINPEDFQRLRQVCPFLQRD